MVAEAMIGGPHCVVTWGRCVACGKTCVVPPTSRSAVCGDECRKATVLQAGHERRLCANAKCRRPFVVLARLRTRYCQDECAAQAWVAAHQPATPKKRRYFGSALEARLSTRQVDRRFKQSVGRSSSRVGVAAPRRRVEDVPKAVTIREPVKHHVVNTHVPGTVAFALLYGSGTPFSRHDGDEVRTTTSALPSL